MKKKKSRIVSNPRGQEPLLATPSWGKKFRIAERLRCGPGFCVSIAVCHKAREGKNKKKKGRGRRRAKAGMDGLWAGIL